MSFQTKPAPSSRITKSRRSSGVAALGLKRATSSPSSASPRKKPSPADAPVSYDDDEQLNDTGVIASLADDLNFRDVPQFIEYIQNNMFSKMPEKAGMNSTRIAEVLNYRRNLPPFVTIAHIDALSTSSTRVEREIAELAQAGILRRITIPHRGVGAAAVGDGIASVREWHNIVHSHEGLTEDLKGTLTQNSCIVQKLTLTSQVHIHHERKPSINISTRHLIHTSRNLRASNRRLIDFHQRNQLQLIVCHVPRRQLTRRSFYLWLPACCRFVGGSRWRCSNTAHTWRHIPCQLPHNRRLHLQLLTAKYRFPYQTPSRSTKPSSRYFEEDKIQ